METNWVKNDPTGNGRIARLFLNDVEYSKIILTTIQGKMIFGTITGQAYDRVDIDERDNFVTIAFSVFEGKRNHRYREQRGRRLIHTITLIADEVQEIFKQK